MLSVPDVQVQKKIAVYLHVKNIQPLWKLCETKDNYCPLYCAQVIGDTSVVESILRNIKKSIKSKSIREFTAKNLCDDNFWADNLDDIHSVHDALVRLHTETFQIQRFGLGEPPLTHQEEDELASTLLRGGYFLMIPLIPPYGNQDHFVDDKIHGINALLQHLQLRSIQDRSLPSAYVEYVAQRE